MWIDRQTNSGENPTSSNVVGMVIRMHGHVAVLHSGRTPVFDQRTFPVPRSICG